MSSKNYWMAEIDRVKLDNNAIRASGDKTKKIIRLAPMHKDPIYMAKLKSEITKLATQKHEYEQKNP